MQAPGGKRAYHQQQEGLKSVAVFASRLAGGPEASGVAAAGMLERGAELLYDLSNSRENRLRDLVGQLVQGELDGVATAVARKSLLALAKERFNPPRQRFPGGVMPVLVLAGQWRSAERVEGQHPAVRRVRSSISRYTVANSLRAPSEVCVRCRDSDGWYCSTVPTAVAVVQTGT
jgi:hypothetical protein